MVTDTEPVAGPGEDWCSINEAAQRLGVTATAVRNRIKRGTLKVRPNGNFGRLVHVPRPVPVTVTLTPGEPMTVTVPEPVTLTVPDTVGMLVTELRNRITELQERLAAADAEWLAHLQELEGMREQVAMHETVKAQVVTLTVLLDEVRQDRDRWHAAATARRSWWPWRRG